MNDIFFVGEVSPLASNGCAEILRARFFATPSRVRPGHSIVDFRM
jgi:hypothetical protein